MRERGVRLRPTSAALAGVALLALLVAAVVALAGSMLYRATVVREPRQPTPTPAGSVVWFTHWQRDSASVAFKSALDSSQIPAPPVIAGQTVYALGTDRRLHAIDAATGIERWAFGYQDTRRIVDFRVTPGRLVLLVREPNAAGLADSFLVGLDPGTRLATWTRPLDADVFAGGLEVCGDTAYLAVADNVDAAQYRAERTRSATASLHPRLRAYALPDGSRRWEQPLPERADVPLIDRLSLIVTDHEVIVMQLALDGSIGIAGLARTTGVGLWRDLTGTEALGLSQHMLVTRSGGDLALVTTATGKAATRLPSLGAGTGATVIDHDVLYATGPGQVTAVDLVARRRLWTTPLAALSGPAAASSTGLSPTVQAGHLYFGAGDGRVYSLAPATGILEWRFPILGEGMPGPGDAPLQYRKLVLVQADQLVAYEAP